MRCPYCGFEDTKVIDSRDSDDGIRRRRECLSCGERFTTFERVQAVGLQVVKKDGRREDFSREKLLLGMRRACEKRPLPVGSIEAVVDDIEATLQAQGKAEVPSGLIGELVMDHLRELDHIAYIRFASVYRAFADIDSLREELERLSGASLRDAPRLAGQLALIPDEVLDQLEPSLRPAPRRGRPGRKRLDRPRPGLVLGQGTPPGQQRERRASTKGGQATAHPGGSASGEGGTRAAGGQGSS
jgi:transcriptional repressor NrdR